MQNSIVISSSGRRWTENVSNLTKSCKSKQNDLSNRCPRGEIFPAKNNIFFHTIYARLKLGFQRISAELDMLCQFANVSASRKTSLNIHRRVIPKWIETSSNGSMSCSVWQKCLALKENHSLVYIVLFYSSQNTYFCFAQQTSVYM